MMDFVGIPCPQINVHTTIQQYHLLKLLLKENEITSVGMNLAV